MQIILILGCGYTGLRLGIRLRKLGYRVIGTARSAAHIDAMQVAGIEAVTGDLDQPALRSLAALRPAVVACFVAPPRSGVDPLPLMLQAFRDARMEAFLYASSTAVYGDRFGDWVDESTRVEATETADVRRIAAEALVGDAVRQHGLPARICRISGIYGPGRTLRALLQSGQYRLIRECDPWVGRIHVDDLVTGLVAAWKRGRGGGLYNMVDERPHRASEFANLAADLNGLPRPDWIDEAEARSRYEPDEYRRKVASKRIKCAALKEELEVQLKYPAYTDGLPAAVAEDRRSPA
ncbi:MAG TPA: NAD-dependent epimerase/dehydratase family protein [Chromatiales bacterium]|nr:NAD-dependent epimerase/dehydratase family protein [Chromatiales bacterium]